VFISNNFSACNEQVQAARRFSSFLSFDLQLQRLWRLKNKERIKEANFLKAK